MEPNDIDAEETDKSSFLNKNFTSNQDNEQDTEGLGLLGPVDSPYPEVNINVSNQDDPTLPCLTFRSIFIGLLFTCIFSFVNQFFVFRTLPISLGMTIAQLLSYPMGRTMAAILPSRKFTIFNERWSFSLNPGPFSIKEHCVITTMANAGSGTPMAINVIIIQRLFYNRYLNNVLALLFIISSQTLGYGMAGIMRKFLVWPAAMIWPNSLADCALFRAMHNSENYEKTNNNDHQRMTRMRFFCLAVLFQFLWHWIPGYICPILSTFSLFCYINPSNVILSQITGFNGLGLGSFTFNWNALVSFLGSPITSPLWTQMNILVGFIFIVWIINPLAYYLNLWNTQTMPIMSNRVFTVEGYYYNVSAVLDSNLQLNETAYKIYGEMRLAAIFAFQYGIGFASITCILVHTILYHSKSIRSHFRSSLSDAGNDIHAKLMSHYPEAPELWYTILFIVAFITASLVCHFGELMPFYMLFLAVAVAFIFLLPTGIMAALTNMMIGLNILTEFIVGLIMPGNPMANVTFKTYGYIAQHQALNFLYDLKFGHYMKIPPRIMFSTQILATLVACVINFSTALYLINTIPDICTSKNIEWTCPGPVTFYSASIIWGVIGPLKMFGLQSIYWPLLFGFLIGALLPIPSWFLSKKYPDVQWLKYIHFPVILSATNAIPPAPAGEYPSWLAVGFLFNFVLFRYATQWWKRYAFIFSAAMSCGVALSALSIFFIFTSHNINFPTWWGSGGPTGDGCSLSIANFSGSLPRYKHTY